MTYDKTTKKKILSYGAGHTASEAIVKFDISRGTFYRWLKESQEGYVKPKRKPFFRKLDPEKLKQYVLENPNLTGEQIGIKFGTSGTAVIKALHKLNFSFKKRSFSTENEMNRSEQNTKKK
ncbi:IS630 transposase-related protein [Lactococcus garvieae]|uniref:IS630 transposase-related protein n=1 Tax=Lactococcus garvieae TaxID=1363 RepID=UPI00324F717B